MLCSYYVRTLSFEKVVNKKKKEETNVALSSVETYARAGMLSPNLWTRHAQSGL